MARKASKKRAKPTKSQRKTAAKSSYKKMSRKHARLKKAQYAINGLVNEMKEGEQFVDVSDSPHAIYGHTEFHKNMLNGALFCASSTACAEMSKIKALEGEGAGRSPGGEWQRQKINSADDERTMRVLESRARKAVAQLRRDNRLPKNVKVAIDLHFEERWDGARLNKRGVTREQGRINKEARTRLVKERRLVKSRHSRGTSHFEAYIVAQIVENGAQVVLACIRVDDLSNLARFIPVLAEKIRAAGVTHAMLLLDRAFFDEACIHEMNRTGFHWILPCRNTGGVKKVLADVDGKGMDRAVRRAEITGEDGRRSGYWMCVEPRKKGEADPGDPDPGQRGGKKLEAHQRLIGFAMSHKSEKPRKYKKRWGIETRFKMVSLRRNKTSSTRPPARLLAFVYSLFATNVWVMVNSVYWRRASDYIPRMSLTAVLSMSVMALEIREPKPPT